MMYDGIVSVGLMRLHPQPSVARRKKIDSRTVVFMVIHRKEGAKLRFPSQHESVLTVITHAKLEYCDLLKGILAISTLCEENDQAYDRQNSDDQRGYFPHAIRAFTLHLTCLSVD